MNDVLGTCDGLRKCRVDLKPPAPLALTRWADILSLSSSSGCLEPVDFPCRSSGPSLSKQADAHLMMFTVSQGAARSVNHATFLGTGWCHEGCVQNTNRRSG